MKAGAKLKGKSGKYLLETSRTLELESTTIARAHSIEKPK